jgi:hypothetical protein
MAGRVLDCGAMAVVMVLTPLFESESELAFDYAMVD